MCDEIFLAFLYFICIFIINYFLFKLIISYFLDIKSIYKLKKVLNLYSKKEANLIPTLYFNLKKKSFLLAKTQEDFNYSSRNDYLLVGNYYKFLINEGLVKKSLSTQALFYYSLLKEQYLQNSQSY